MKRKTSYIINLGLLLLTAAGFLFAKETLPYQLLLSAGLFGLSGSLTNSLAIHMLFEKIPLVYGSGIIALNFCEIKDDLEALMIREFFNSKQIERFISLEAVELDVSQLTKWFDFEQFFTKFRGGLEESFKGNPLAMMAMPLLEANRQKIIAAIRGAVASELGNPELKEQIKNLLGHQLEDTQSFEQRIRFLIRSRLNELSPQMVKEIILHMMESRLIWLVIWGAVIGALMGLAAALFRYYLLP